MGLTDTYIDAYTVIGRHQKQRDQDYKFNVMIFTDITREPKDKLVTMFINLFKNIC